MIIDIGPTRNLLENMSGWVDDLARRLPEPERQFFDEKRFIWRHAQASVEVLQVAKAVRLVTALRGALTLADAKLTTECGSLLRTASDFADEIMFLCEPELTGKTTTALRKFVEQAFASIPTSLDEWREWERDRYVGRGAVYKALGRMAERTGQDGDLLRTTASWLIHGYDKYVHGSYDSAMELYHGGSRRFTTEATESERLINGSLRAVAWKTHDGVAAFELMSFTRGPGPLYSTIQRERRRHESALVHYLPPEGTA